MWKGEMSRVYFFFSWPKTTNFFLYIITVVEVLILEILDPMYVDWATIGKSIEALEI